MMKVLPDNIGIVDQREQMFPARSLINERQNDPASQSLLRAMSVSHHRAQRMDSLQLTISVVVSAAGVVATFASATVVTAIALIGGVWALVYSVGLASWANNELRRAALLQEMFDVRLFEFKWNSVIAGDPLEPEEVSRLNRSYRGDNDMFYDYYEIPVLPRPYDVLACQLQNLGWGARVRRRYAHTVLAGVLIWVSTGLVIGGIIGLSVLDLTLRWYVPSLGMLLFGADVYRGQRDIAVDRDRIRALLRAKIQISTQSSILTIAEMITFSRQVQDLIFLTRLRQIRVPNWFFLRFQARDSLDFEAAIRELVSILK
jgi:hypothetical protein